MIHYALRCDEGHAFDGWFASSEAFETQRQGGQLSCPVCGGTKVDKALMAPAVSAKTRGAEPDEGAGPGSSPSGKAPVAAMPAPAALPPQLVEALREVRRLVKVHSEYVGDKFAEEARKIHYEEADPRGIYGEASPEEAKALSEEGIEFHPLPLLPEDLN
ncbi:DUF1178 family protein [Afifella sp. IM 167]|uniref:DUF1178 family protein n=1 Tax=Afifella sp. IM 167 TaxID=2033586 RepID=UPI001CCA7036|nr:DUF1178 family protein [Afifella sp. IM 167]MBZ8133020.1 hypothetical protein [Afifella sp. IM 167]